MADVKPKSLKTLRAEEAHCTRCPLYMNATQVVPGEISVRKAGRRGQFNPVFK